VLFLSFFFLSPSSSPPARVSECGEGVPTIELADYCNAKKVHLIYDKREHPKQSLLQQSLGMVEIVSSQLFLLYFYFQ